MKLDGSGRVVLDDTPTPAEFEPDDLWAASVRGEKARKAGLYAPVTHRDGENDHTATPAPKRAQNGTESEECWAPVPGFKGAYEVSSHGRVRSVDRIITRKNGVRVPMRGRIRKTRPNKSNGRSDNR